MSCDCLVIVLPFQALSCLVLSCLAFSSPGLSCLSPALSDVSRVLSLSCLAFFCSDLVGSCLFLFVVLSGLALVLSGLALVVCVSARAPLTYLAGRACMFPIPCCVRVCVCVGRGRRRGDTLRSNVQSSCLRIPVPSQQSVRHKKTGSHASIVPSREPLGRNQKKLPRRHQHDRRRHHHHHRRHIRRRRRLHRCFLCSFVRTGRSFVRSFVRVSLASSS